MTRPALLLAALAATLLTACNRGPRGDWRLAFGETTANPVVLTPAQPLAIPAVLDLPPPGGANRATPGR